MQDWSALDLLGDRAAVDLITKLLDGTATLPFGKLSDDRYLKLLSARLRKIALACDVPPAVTTTNRLDVDVAATAGASVSATVPGGLDFHRIKDLIGELGAAMPEPPRLVECAYLDGLTDADGNPAAFLINDAAVKNALPRLVMARTPGKTQQLVLMTPQFAELLAAEAAKHSMKLVIEGRR